MALRPVVAALVLHNIVFVSSASNTDEVGCSRHAAAAADFIIMLSESQNESCFCAKHGDGIVGRFGQVVSDTSDWFDKPKT